MSVRLDIAYKEFARKQRSALLFGLANLVRYPACLPASWRPQQKPRCARPMHK